LTKIAYVLCTGCPESRIDSARVQNFLRENGWNITNDLKEADLILFRTCGLTGKTAAECLQLIRMVKAKKKENAQFIVWGCLSKIDPEALRTEYNGITFSEKEVAFLNKILAAKKPIEEVVANYVMPVFEPNQSGLYGCLRKLHDFVDKHFSIVQNASIFQIKVSTGCLDNCSFCSVHKSRGVLRSKSIDKILSEFREGLNKGFRYFGLLGTDVGAYGKDIGHNLVDLLTHLTKEKGDYKIGLRNINPYHLKEMFEQLRPIFASGKIWFLSSAAQSGSNRILKLMRRRYKIQDFMKCIQTLNKESPNVFIRSQIIVGFPTETDEDFRKSLHLLDELKFDWVEVYRYSPRRGTLAATMTGQIPEKIKEARFRQLTLKATVQRPHMKMKQMLQSYRKSHCERQDWTPLT
jgi:MiaB/RimO family radical SAM methylthiotransferase